MHWIYVLNICIQIIFRSSHINKFNVFSIINPVSLSFNSTPSTVLFNGQVMFVHPDSEESWLSPVGSPTVSSHPIFNSILDAPTYYSAFVVNHRYQFDLLENTSSISIKFLSCINTAWNRSSVVNLSFHLLSSRNCTVLLNSPNWIFLLSPTITFVSRFGSLRRSAVHTFLNIWTAEMVWVLGSVSLTSLFRDTVMFTIFIDTDWVASIAWSSGFTVDNNLWG